MVALEREVERGVSDHSLTHPTINQSASLTHSLTISIELYTGYDLIVPASALCTGWSHYSFPLRCYVQAVVTVYSLFDSAVPNE